MFKVALIGATIATAAAAKSVSTLTHKEAETKTALKQLKAKVVSKVAAHNVKVVVHKKAHAKKIVAAKHATSEWSGKVVAGWYRKMFEHSDAHPEVTETIATQPAMKYVRQNYVQKVQYVDQARSDYSSSRTRHIRKYGNASWMDSADRKKAQAALKEALDAATDIQEKVQKSTVEAVDAVKGEQHAIEHAAKMRHKDFLLTAGVAIRKRDLKLDADTRKKIEHQITTNEANQAKNAAHEAIVTEYQLKFEKDNAAMIAEEEKIRKKQGKIATTVIHRPTKLSRSILAAARKLRVTAEKRAHRLNKDIHHSIHAIEASIHKMNNIDDKVHHHRRYSDDSDSDSYPVEEEIEEPAPVATVAAPVEEVSAPVETVAAPVQTEEVAEPAETVAAPVQTEEVAEPAETVAAPVHVEATHVETVAAPVQTEEVAEPAEYTDDEEPAEYTDDEEPEYSTVDSHYQGGLTTQNSLSTAFSAHAHYLY